MRGRGRWECVGEKGVGNRKKGKEEDAKMKRNGVTRKGRTGKRGGEGKAVSGKGGHLNSQIPEALMLPRCWVSCLRECSLKSR